MKPLNTLLTFLVTATILQAQVLISDETTPTAISANAILELRTLSESKGILLPRVNLSSTNDPSPCPLHIAGMLVYNLATTSGAQGVTPGLYYNDGSSWYKMEANMPSIGDIKYTSTTTDHDGWYLLNGRAITLLPATAQVNASVMGITVNLPNTEDTFLKGKIGSETLGSVTGTNTTTLGMVNLPSVTYSVTTQTTGAHTHTYSDRGTGVMNSQDSGVVMQIVDNTAASGATSGASGDHAHTYTVTTGGTDTPINVRPLYLSANIFIYLGK